MRGKSLGECAGKVDAFPLVRLGTKHEQKIFVASLAAGSDAPEGFSRTGEPGLDLDQRE
jgi:hypothetical protein